jgi:predicted transcriptional regulator
MAKRPKHTKAKTKKKAPAPKRVQAVAKKAAARKPAVKKSAARKAGSQKSGVNKYRATRMVMVTIPQHITLDLPPVLHDRLKALSKVMDMPMEAVIRQALSEFADTWEDHHRTVAALADTSDRMQVVVKDE